MKNLNNLGRIILASKSPRRIDILKKINLDFKVIPSNIIEDFDKTNPSTLVQTCAFEKAKKISGENLNNFVIGADTVVLLDKKIMGKPRNINESREMLGMLSGKTHKVFTGVSIQNINKNINELFYSMTEVELYSISDTVIDYYIKNYKPSDKAGSYGIQDWFSSQIKKINGCYYNVMGLPLSKVFKCLYDLSMNNIND
ncbi:MAG: septum formation protein Maf [Candidatus Marinimicrobia bacterium]|nr:septum formation protein Maf [Candidatus Neomarinimicrobiota bacterium]|tara:strand:- start:1409 stop:2005 length:597 start_codon:yes stop_codon:yes gene_type:complete